MRLLNQSEVSLVSGGEDELTLGVVVVVGTRQLSQHQLFRIWQRMGEGDGGGTGGGSGGGGGGGGGGGYGFYDPSPDDGFRGLDVTILDDRIEVILETRGFWDINNNGERDPGEGPAGPPGTEIIIYHDWGTSYDNAIDILNSFTPFAPAGV